MNRAPLTSIRFLLAMHLLVFHFLEHCQSVFPESYARFLATVPEWLVSLLQHGYCSTGAFFLLSGFVLAEHYLGQQEVSTVSRSEFWYARFSRVFPLHLAVLVLFSFHFFHVAMRWQSPHFLGHRIDSDAFTFIAAISSLTLTQAWLPGYSLLGNPPTWALSVVSFFYLLFPLLGPSLAKRSNTQQWTLLLLGPWLALAPSVVYLMSVRQEIPFSFWHELLMRSPLLWLPHFATGILLHRVCNRASFSAKTVQQNAVSITIGDLAFLLLSVLLCLPDTLWKNLLAMENISPKLLLRNGALLYLWMLIFVDLARGRGIFARVLQAKSLAALGDLSFSIFILQMPVMIVVNALLPNPLITLPTRMLIVILSTLITSKLSYHYFEVPVNRWLRQRWRVRQTLVVVDMELPTINHWLGPRGSRFTNIESRETMSDHNLAPSKREFIETS